MGLDSIDYRRASYDGCLWSNPKFRQAFRDNLRAMKDALPNHSSNPGLLRRQGAHIDAVIKATRSTKLPEFID